MALKHGNSTKVFLDAYDVSAYSNSADATLDVDLPDTTCFGDAGRTREVVGLKDCTITIGGFHDTTAGSLSAASDALYGSATASTVTMCPQGSGTLGDPAILMQTRVKSVKKGAQVDGVVPYSVDYQGDGGADLGLLLHSLHAETTSTAETGIDNAAASTNGGVGHLHVTSVSASDTADVLIEGSTNNSDWTTLITFAQSTAASSQRLTCAGTVPRYVRSSVTIGGTDPSITYVVAFARR